jgi:hypothetical protein
VFWREVAILQIVNLVKIALFNPFCVTLGIMIPLILQWVGCVGGVCHILSIDQWLSSFHRAWLQYGVVLLPRRERRNVITRKELTERSTFRKINFRDVSAHLFFRNRSLHMSLRVVRVALKCARMCARSRNERFLRNRGSILRLFR